MEAHVWIQRAFEHCLQGDLLERTDILRLLAIDPASPDALFLRETAAKAAREITGGAAYLWGAIGIDRKPCPMNCAFCSFGEKWNLIEEERIYTDQEIIAQVRAFVQEGTRFIVLRTTEFYSIDLLREKLAAIRRAVPGPYELILNIGEFDLPTACSIHQAGAAGIYHALRLREGIDTSFVPAARRATLSAIQNSPLKLISLVEPVGPEHTNEELADAFLTAASYGAVISGAMARVPVPGTPLGQLPILPTERLAQLIAVFRLAAGRRIPDICVHPASAEAVQSGANVVVVETGAIPRDQQIAQAEWNRFTAQKATALLQEAGYTVSPCAQKASSVSRGAAFSRA